MPASKINREFFFQKARADLFDGKMRQTQIGGITGILDEWERKYAAQDDRWLAYMLATTHHETDRTMQPIREYGRGKGKPYGVEDPDTHQTYYGRGFVQLTWKENYQRLGTDLVNNADRALDLPIATQVLFVGMTQGRFGRRKEGNKILFYKLSEFFNKTTEDWVNARKIINRLDRANLIADYGKAYYGVISYTT